MRVMDNTAKDLRYLRSQDKFMEYAYCALREHFSSRTEFDNYYNSIATDDQKNLFLKTASFYLFLVKRGDWKVDIPGSNELIDYLTNTYKYIVIFSLIESLSDKKFIDFYEFLSSKMSKISFPIGKKQLEKYYEEYKYQFGSIRRCISFFQSLNTDSQEKLISKLEIRETKSKNTITTQNKIKPTIDKFAKYLYELRSEFVHKAELILDLSKKISVGKKGGKVVIWRLSIDDCMSFFEEGLLIYFRVKTS